jgi:hypothetical protein
MKKSFTIGNIDLNTLRECLWNKRRRRKLERKMLSILKRFPIKLELMIKRIGLSLILVTLILFVPSQLAMIASSLVVLLDK